MSSCLSSVSVRPCNGVRALECQSVLMYPEVPPNGMPHDRAQLSVSSRLLSWTDSSNHATSQ